MGSAGGGPLVFTVISKAIRTNAGKGDTPADERWSDVRTYRGLKGCESRGRVQKTDEGWVLIRRRL